MSVIQKKKKKKEIKKAEGCTEKKGAGADKTGWVCVILIKMHYTHTHENVNEYIMIILKIVFPPRKWRKVYVNTVVNQYSYGKVLDP